MFFHFWLFQEDELIFSHLEIWNRFGRTYACFPIGSRRILSFKFIAEVLCIILHIILWLFEFFSNFLRGLCCAVIQLYTPSSSDGALRITYAGSSSHNLSTMTSTCVLIIASSRARWCGSTFSVRVQRVGCQCTTGRCYSNEVSDAMRCGDATAMRPRRRRCDCAETGAETDAETGAETGAGISCKNTGG